MPVTTDDKLMRRLLQVAERELRDEWTRVNAWLRDRWPLDKLEQAIRDGDLTALSEDLDRAMSTFVRAGTAHSIEGADEIAAHVGETIGQLHAFDAHGERFVAKLRAEEDRLARYLAGQQRQSWMAAIAEGHGDTELTAKRIRSAVGINGQQKIWIDSYRDALEQNSSAALDRVLRDRRFDATIEGAIASEEPLTAAQIDRMVERYTERMVKYRRGMIARTEATRAVHVGVEEAYQQAVAVGDLVADEITRTWVTRHDNHVRDSHDPMDGQTKIFGEVFTSGDGYHLRYPGDEGAPASETIHCRCYLASRIDYLKRWTRKHGGTAQPYRSAAA